MIYGLGCIVGFIFVVFVQKETRGQSIDDAPTNDKVNNNIDMSNKVNCPQDPLISGQKI